MTHRTAHTSGEWRRLERAYKAAMRRYRYWTDKATASAKKGKRK